MADCFVLFIKHIKCLSLPEMVAKYAGSYSSILLNKTQSIILLRFWRKRQMNPIRAQRVWHSLSMKWISNSPFSSPKRSRKRKIKKGLLSNFIPVEVINAITGEVSKGYMRDLSITRLRKWLAYHNQRAQVEQVSLSVNSTFAHLNRKAGALNDFPVLIKLGKYQVPYLIDRVSLSALVKHRQTFTFNLKTVDNLKYLEMVAGKKAEVMKLFKKIKKAKKK
jgi:hypothetical protein